jgi:hypothetical protein
VPALISLLATFVLLVGSTLLLTTVGRRRRQRGRALEAQARQAIAGVVGTSLAELVAEAIQVRRLLEDTAAMGREMLTIEVQLGGPTRRPLWRQIEDANFGHALERVRRATRGWLARFDGLDAADRQVIELLGLEVAPVRALLELTSAAEEPDTHSNATPIRLPPERSDELSQVIAGSGAAIDCLRRIERELLDYRPGGYR